jgi:hypothetical protein
MPSRSKHSIFHHGAHGTEVAKKSFLGKGAKTEKQYKKYLQMYCHCRASGYLLPAPSRFVFEAA